MLRTDNGTEYVNKDINHLCNEVGIQLQHTVPYTPQQNGVVERKNRSLKDMANCMLHARSLSSKLWVEAINCASYIQNRSPHKSVTRKTPFEAQIGKQREVNHFRIFGSRAWARIPTEKRKALEPQSKACMLVGYSDEVKGYILLDINTEELLIERSLKFDEDILHAPQDEPINKFPSPLIDEYANDT